jgi:PIN domain nuclease of toxin-antitoxin system
MAKYIIDTHALVLFLSGEATLKPEQRKALKEMNSEYYVLTNVFEEIRNKFEKFKKDGINIRTIKIPPIIVWKIAKRCKNVIIRNLENAEVSEWARIKPELQKIKRDDLPFAVLQLILQKQYPKTEVRIITNDDILKKRPLTRTI